MKNALYAYAPAIKNVDAAAQIFAPVSWGWTEYFYLSYALNLHRSKTSSGLSAPRCIRSIASDRARNCIAASPEAEPT